MVDSNKKSGAIIYRKSARGLEYLLIYRAFRRDWSFPKGHIDPGEDAETAMKREVKEETGLEVKIKKRLTDFCYLTPTGELIEVAMYLAVPINVEQETSPEYDGDQVKWVSKEEAIDKLSYGNLKNYFRSLNFEYTQPQ